MGLEMFTMHNKVLTSVEGRIQENNARLLIAVGVVVTYLFIGALVFVRIEYPLEKIERETYREYREQWEQRLVGLGITVLFSGCVLNRMRVVESRRSRILRLIVLLGVPALGFYLVLGAYVIQTLELQSDIEARQKFREAVEDFKLRNDVNQTEIDRLFSDIREAALNGIWMDKNVTSDPNWTFGQAFFFAGTLISTVGYGRVSPRTEHGKLFTICYCVIGIPLTLALLSAIVARMRAPSHRLRGLLNQKLGHLFPPAHIQGIHLGVITSALLLFVFLIPAWVFTTIEPEWTYLDAFYYCFVSLTTIGLGDYEPGDHPDQPMRGVYKIGATLYLMGGLCCMMLFLATLYDVPQLNLLSFLVKSEEESRLNEDETTKYDRFPATTSVENGLYGSVQ
ncbi:unnamed protein product [Caenorhabditis auriculariae]|uniref:Two pore potassium channel protein sup-9 n=1 Tax=Caenorhabditis auriculariae TaxID=2777116 RepID=A0A8S1HLA4_9PELO|nr:unnamed protein product [Caenorhabditis auriculariae]